MIPELPKSVSDEERVDFYATLAGNLSDQSSVHVNWHTHRQNPSVCWICDLNILIAKMLNVCDKHITKSSLDMGTENSSDDESELEIENGDSEESLNYQDEPDLIDGELGNS